MNSAKPSTPSRAVAFPPVSAARKSPTPSPRNTPCGLNSRSTGFAGSRGTTDHHQPLLGAALILVIALLLGLGALHVIRSALDRPDVYTSYLTQQCVKVVNADGTAGSCDALPETYNNHWVD